MRGVKLMLTAACIKFIAMLRSKNVMSSVPWQAKRKRTLNVKM